MIHKNISKLCSAVLLTYCFIFIIGAVFSHALFANEGKNLIKEDGQFKYQVSEWASSSVQRLYLQSTLTSNNRNQGDYQAQITIGGFILGYDFVIGDYFGDKFSTHGDWLAVTSFEQNSVVYLYKKENNSWLINSTVQISNKYRNMTIRNLALHDDTLAIVTITNNLLVYKRKNSDWNQQAIIKMDDLDYRSEFGSSMAISGDTIVVGAKSRHNPIGIYGSAYVFNKINNQWQQTAQLNSDNPVSGDLFGHSIAIENETIVIGAPHAFVNSKYYGAAFVYQYIDNRWQRLKILTSNQNNNAFYQYPTNFSKYLGFGNGVALDHGRIIVNEYIAGVHILQFKSNYATLSSSSLIDDNPNEVSSIAIENDTIVVGSAHDESYLSDINGIGKTIHNNSGIVYTYKYIDQQWVQTNFIKSPKPIYHQEINSEPPITEGPPNTYYDLFGQTVAISNNTIFVGTPGELKGAGAIYTYSADAVYIKAAHTGLWYNPEPLQSSYGLSIKVLTNNRMVATLNIFDEGGNQIWYTGVGT